LLQKYISYLQKVSKYSTSPIKLIELNQSLYLAGEKHERYKEKKLKILFFAAILLTATTAMVISIHNQNTHQLINPYLLGSSSIIQEKTLYISSDYNFTGNIYEPIVVTADNIVIDGKGEPLDRLRREEGRSGLINEGAV